MDQSTARIPSARSGGTGPDRKNFGSLTIIATQTVDGGFAINTFTGPAREDRLSFTTTSRDVARLTYKVIAEGGLGRVHPDGIHSALQDRLSSEYTFALDRRSTEYATALERLLDALETPAQRAASAAMLAGIAENMRGAR